MKYLLNYYLVTDKVSPSSRRGATWMGTGTIEFCFLAVVQHIPTVLGVVARANRLSQEKKSNDKRLR